MGLSFDFRRQPQEPGGDIKKTQAPDEFCRSAIAYRAFLTALATFPFGNLQSVR